MGVGAKIHIIQKHLQTALDELDGDEALGVWSEQAVESSHGAFKKLHERYTSIKNGFLYSVLEYNFLKM